ncbi:hypothetical protein RLIN73S_00019 [Rhodanobacter lindaniclasticus]
MNTSLPQYSPGSLVRARGRERIVQPGSVAPLLRLRPLSGGEDESALVHTGLEPNIGSAHFPAPDPTQEGSQHDAVLLSDALRMALRRGAGPFRCFGNISVEPRTYQLVPLLMALRLDPVRLLIADDVGIGKTIEAALIARELHGTAARPSAHHRAVPATPGRTVGAGNPRPLPPVSSGGHRQQRRAP